MKRRVTIQTIAARAAVHFTTVAEALKNGPRVKPATRERIQALARQMGYVPDPMLSALSAYRKAIKPPIYHETLAWVTTHPIRDGWRRDFGTFRDGAAERAAELGFRLEDFWAKQPGMTSREASRQLFSRGIRGLLIAPLFAARGHLSLEWDRFSSVALGYTLTKPRMNAVSTTHYRAVITSMRRLKAAGHRRIGWVSCSIVDERTDRLWISGFLSDQGLDALQSESLFSFRAFEPKAFLAWYHRFLPDAIVTSCLDANAVEFVDLLRARGCRIPGDLSVAVVNLQKESDLSGVIEPNFLLGRTAVDLVARMLQTGEHGVPERPLLQLIDGSWNEGATIDRRHRRTQAIAAKRRGKSISPPQKSSIDMG